MIDRLKSWITNGLKPTNIMLAVLVTGILAIAITNIHSCKEAKPIPPDPKLRVYADSVTTLNQQLDESAGNYLQLAKARDIMAKTVAAAARRIDSRAFS